MYDSAVLLRISGFSTVSCLPCLPTRLHGLLSSLTLRLLQRAIDKPRVHISSLGAVPELLLPPQRTPALKQPRDTLGCRIWQGRSSVQTSSPCNISCGISPDSSLTLQQQLHHQAAGAKQARLDVQGLNLHHCIVTCSTAAGGVSKRCKCGSSKPWSAEAQAIQQPLQA